MGTEISGWARKNNGLARKMVGMRSLPAEDGGTEMTIRGLVIAGGLLAGTMGSSYVVVLVLAIIDGRYRDAMSLVGVTLLFLGSAVASVKYGSDRVRPRMKVDGTGTTLRPDRLIDVPVLIAHVGMVVNVLATLFAPSSGGWFAATWLKVVIGLGWAVFVFALGVLLWGHLRWGASTYLRLTPAGVEVGQGLRPRSFGWDRVRSVTDQASRARWPLSSSLVVNVSGEKALSMSTGIFTPSGAVLRDMVEFYWRHPEARGELTDGSAPRRLAATLTVFR